MKKVEYLDILSVKVSLIDYEKLKSVIIETINNKTKIFITYTTANTLNLIYQYEGLKNIFNKFDIIHPDGIGVYLSSKFIYGKNGFKNRFTGSDFYPVLIEAGIKNKWSFFLFGDTEKTLLEAIKKNNTLNICGYQNGYDYIEEKLVEKINSSTPDILIVGLGCPKQEELVFKYKDQINAKIILAVGDGIKVFAGTKRRGANFLRLLGFEWFVRLITNPKKYWKRYILGIPLFVIRIIKFKLSYKIRTDIQ